MSGQDFCDFVPDDPSCKADTANTLEPTDNGGPSEGGPGNQGGPGGRDGGPGGPPSERGEGDRGDERDGEMMEKMGDAMMEA